MNNNSCNCLPILHFAIFQLKNPQKSLNTEELPKIPVQRIEICNFIHTVHLFTSDWVWWLGSKLAGKMVIELHPLQLINSLWNAFTSHYYSQCSSTRVNANNNNKDGQGRYFAAAANQNPFSTTIFPGHFSFTLRA